MKTVFFLQSSLCSSNRAQLAGAIRAGKAFGWTVRVIEYAGTATGLSRFATDNDDFRTEFRRMKDFWSPIGIIVDCGAAPNAFRKDEFAPLPTVFLDRSPDTIGKGAVCICSDATDIGTLAARELLALDYKTYAYAPFTENLSWSICRERAYAQALKLNHCRCRTFRKGRKSVDNVVFLQELARWMRELEKPAAIFAANDYIGELVLLTARKYGYQVPQDLAVLGVDNDEDICLRTNPPLSSIKPDHERAGYLAASLLKRLVDSPKRPPASETFGSLAVFHRNSTRALHRHDARVDKAVDIIRARACTGLTVPQLVAEMGVSRRLLELRFRETLGRTILGEIQSVRLERAKDLLSHSQDQMGDIANAAGFPSVQTFRKAFIQSVGTPPLVWRKRQLEK